MMKTQCLQRLTKHETQTRRRTVWFQYHWEETHWSRLSPFN